jgi:hypothetical protein
LRVYLLIVFFVLFYCSGARGFFSDQTGGYPAEYLYSFSGDARGLALGLAQTAASGRASDLYSNPASIANLWWQEASFSFTPLFEDTQLMALFYGYPFKEKYTIGAGLLRLSSQGAEKTNELGEAISTFSDNETALLVGCGYKLSEELRAGADIKLLSQDIDTYSARNFGLDAGLIYDYTPTHTWALALMNVLPGKMGEDDLPAVARIGFLHRFFQKKLNLAFDASFIDVLKNQASTRWYMGIEYFLYEWLSLRGGVNQKQISAGFGLNQRLIDLNYAFIYNPLGLVHSVTLNLRYGFLPTEAEKKAKEDLDEINTRRADAAQAAKAQQKEIDAERQQLDRDRKSTMQFLKAYDVFKKGDFGAAKVMLNKILTGDPDYQDARELLGEVEARLDSSVISKRLESARYYYKQSAYAEALKNVDYILKADPQQQEARVIGFLSQARMSIDKKDYSSAKGSLIETLKTDPRNAEAMELLKRIQTIIEVNEK